MRPEVEREPQVAGSCHWEDCRLWRGAPIDTWATWPSKKAPSHRGPRFNRGVRKGDNLRCSKCGSGIISRKPNRRTVVYAVVLAASGFCHRAEFRILCHESFRICRTAPQNTWTCPRSGAVLAEPKELGLHSIRTLFESPEPNSCSNNCLSPRALD